MKSRDGQPRRRRTAIVMVLCAGVAGTAIYAGYTMTGGATRDAARTPAQQRVPVTVAAVQAADFPVYLNGLGSVQPYDTVTVRGRVDGQVVSVGFRQGQMVKEGDVLAQVDPRPYQAALDQALAKKAQDEATLKDARLNLQRYGALATRDFASRQQLDTQQATVDQLVAQRAGDQAMIDTARTNLDYCTIRAPLSGKTGFRQIDPGNIIHASDTTGIVTIVKLQPISVVFTAPEEEVPRINAALAAGPVPVFAMNADGGKVLSQGRLALVNNTVDQASGTIRMKATFANTDNALWPGMSVSTRLLIDTLKQATVVPDDAIQRGPDGLFAFVVGDDGKVSTQTVERSQAGQGRSVIAKGLSPGQTVVVAGQYRLQSGTQVRTTPADPPNALAAAGGDAVREP